MELTELKTIIEQAIADSTVVAEGDGYHFTVTVISDAFDNQSRVKRQQLVYQALNDKIQSGELHAISINTYTKQQWNNIQSEHKA